MATQPARPVFDGGVQQTILLRWAISIRLCQPRYVYPRICPSLQMAAVCVPFAHSAYPLLRQETQDITAATYIRPIRAMIAIESMHSAWLLSSWLSMSCSLITHCIAHDTLRGTYSSTRDLHFNAGLTLLLFAAQLSKHGFNYKSTNDYSSPRALSGIQGVFSKSPDRDD